MQEFTSTQNARQFYSVHDLVTVAGISRSLAYAWVQMEDFPKIRVGKRVLIPVDAFNAWVDEQIHR